MADAAITIFLLICVGRGIFKGPVIELFSIAGTFCGLVAAGWLYSSIAAMLPNEIMSEAQRWMTGFLSLFGVVYFLLSLLGVVANYLMRVRLKGWIVHLSGAGLGLCKGILVVAILLVPLIAFFPNKVEWLRRGATFPYERRISATIIRITPKRLQSQFSSQIDSDGHPSPKREIGFTRSNNGMQKKQPESEMKVLWGAQDDKACG